MIGELEKVREALEAIQYAEGRRPGMHRTVGAFEQATKALRIIDRLIAGAGWREREAVSATQQPDEYMTVVFRKNAASFDKNPLHIQSEFGEIVAISRGDALEERDKLYAIERFKMTFMREGRYIGSNNLD